MHVQSAAGPFRLVPIPPSGAIPGLAAALPDEVAAIVAEVRVFYRRAGHSPPWVCHLSVLDGAVVGGGAFVGPPRDGMVEIAYFTLPAWQRSGLALRTARALLAIAASCDPRPLPWAKTLPEAGPSTRVLERLGFCLDGEVDDHEVGTAWRWVLAARGPARTRALPRPRPQGRRGSRG